ncbi:uncharacterized protein STEHIDRAFT_115077 [Stereum hirsutum FP-91666 SS1]|uniref:uncharacterized protein n=1 Tax=Stereum hirsutum (strain FP-91666) TaxID=721885 RepID=UPI0004449BBE|nr:uncharacterized protein STEHIDRAFT_115077 [Stereum hirsutum FP-91666 SS1]EIM81702.1 hypothetical protein STEHIDRAFT_115077 [Stereum hirsutum FP-91666 SS1]
MSDASDLQQVIFALEIWQISDYTAISANALWILDYLQTLPMEIEAIWMKKMSGSSLLFLLNRYLFIVYLVCQTISETPGTMSDEACYSLNVILSVTETATIIATSCLFTLRVYAIYSKSLVIFIIGMVLTLARLGTDIASNIPLSGESTRGSIYESFSRCADSIDDSKYNEYLIVSTSIFVLALAFDSFMFVMTIARTFKHGREMRRLGQATPTTIILIPQSNFTIGPDSFPNLLINRLVLNLRMYQRPRYGLNTTTKQHSNLAFATNRILGNIGAPLDPDQWDEDYDIEGTFDSGDSDEVVDSQHGEEKDGALRSPATVDSGASESPVDEEMQITPVQRSLSTVAEDAV